MSEITLELMRDVIERNAKSAIGRHVFSDSQYAAIADELNATLGSGECDTHWHELFGTPVRAARTMIDTLAACEGPQCQSGKCPFRQMQHCPDYDDYDALIEWLIQPN